MVLAMTHEEAVTFHVAQVVRSYRDLPLLLYHFQTKERDEPRPRAGVLRTREFIMKDAYSFDRDAGGLDDSYEKFVGAYDRIFDRFGLEWYRVESDVGMMGGFGAHEYMAPCPAGENDVALAPGYAANVEVASAEAQPVRAARRAGAEPATVQTPGMTTIDAVAEHLGVPAGALLKAFPVVTDDRGLVMVVVRGDHRVNEIKLQNALGATVPPGAARRGRRAHRPARLHRPGGHRPARPARRGGRRPAPTSSGANAPDAHLAGVEPGRDFRFERVDVRTVEAGDTRQRQPDPDRARDRGRQHLQARHPLLRAARRDLPRRVRQRAAHLDGLLRHRPGAHRRGGGRAVRRREGHLLAARDRAVGRRARRPRQARARPSARPRRSSTTSCAAAGLDVLYDDRDAGPGEKFADAELLGVPLRLTLGKRSLESGAVEAQIRRGRADHEGGVPLEGAAEAVAELWRSLP